jgi:hypothetical protein
MEPIDIYLVAALLIGAGCGATVLSAYVFPLWIRVLGQAHGRFAGLSAAEPSPVDGSKRKVSGPGPRASTRPDPGLIVT